MGGNGGNINGYGYLTLAQAVEIARNSESGVDPNLAQFLERCLNDVWARLYAAPHSYILTKDEFALFNYYRQRFQTDPTAQSAVRRFWNHYGTAS